MAKITAWEIKKNIHDLKYQRTLSEHNVWMASSFILSFSVIGVMYEVFSVRSVVLLTVLGSAIFLIVNKQKVEAERKLDKITAEIEQLS